MNTVTAQNQKGFTLVEIAIVLVIIGLLLGGVLKGQELMTNAKAKNVTQDLEGIVTAYYAYQDRTGIIPGDLLNGTTAGQDGKIDEEDGTDGFWALLRTQGFIKGAATDGDGPTHALDGAFQVIGGDVAANAMFTKNHLCASNIAPAIAQGIDNKLDDGDPETGIVRAGTAVTAAIDEAYSGTAVLFVCREF